MLSQKLYPILLLYVCLLLFNSRVSAQISDATPSNVTLGGMAPSQPTSGPPISPAKYLAVEITPHTSHFHAMSKFLTLQALDYTIYLLSSHGRDMQEVSYPGYRPGEPRIELQPGSLTVRELIYVFKRARSIVKDYTGQGRMDDFIPPVLRLTVQGVGSGVVLGSIYRE